MISADAYSTTLALALAAAIVALVLAVARRLEWLRGAGVRRGALVAALSAIVLLGLATIHHVIFDHAPGSSSALGMVAFVAAHPALWVVSGLAAAALAIGRTIGGPRSRPLDETRPPGGRAS